MGPGYSYSHLYPINFSVLFDSSQPFLIVAIFAYGLKLSLIIGVFISILLTKFDSTKPTKTPAHWHSPPNFSTTILQ